MAKLYGKDLSKYDDIDLDDLLAKLTEEELEELETELIDPDVSVPMRWLSNTTFLMSKNLSACTWSVYIYMCGVAH